MILKICDIIKTELNLSASNIWFYNQKVNIPNDNGTYVIVGILSRKTLGNNTKYEATQTGLNEVQCLNLQEVIEVDVIGKTTQVLDYVNYIQMALKSTYAQQQQEKNGFSIGYNSINVVNVEEVEGVSELYRFNITFNILYAIEKSKAVEYYNKFQTIALKTEA